MENIPDLGDRDATLELDVLEDTNVLQCAMSHAKRFVACDVPLADSGGANGAPSSPLLGKLAAFRGEPSLVPKGKCLYAVDDPSRATFDVYTTPPHFRAHRPPTLRFFSVYADLPSTAASASCELVSLPRGGSAAPITKVERVVFHPVSQGCMRQSGVAVTRVAGRRSSTALPAEERQASATAQWNLYWGARFKNEADFRTLLAFQRVNHFPGTFLLGRKDNLAKQIVAHRFLMKASKRDAAFDFVPLSYTIPGDLKLLGRDAAAGHVFIVKPPASACGRGIFLFRGSIPRDVAEFAQRRASGEASSAAAPPRHLDPAAATGSGGDDEDENAAADGEYLVQRYIRDPFLLNGFKVDLRLYVACTSFDPLRAYIFNDGLVRFASEPYPLDIDSDPDLENLFRHLTNYSVNKKAATYVRTNAAEDDGAGSKWSLHALKRHFAAHGLDWGTTWREITDVVVKTLIACEADVCSKMMQSAKYRSSCFELFGFDVMLDAKLKPYLIEVNVMPSLACASALDKHIKGHMVADLLTMVGVPYVDKSDGGDATVSPGVNMPLASLKRTPAAKALLLESPATYFAAEATSEDKQVLRDAEEELRRSGGFARLIPGPDAGACFGPLFSSSRHFNHLLWQWEALKARFSDDDKAAARLWLQDAGPFPGAKRAAASSAKKLPSTLPPAPRPKLSSSRLTNSRVNAAPKRAAEKFASSSNPVLKAPIRVCSFEFVDVKKPK